MTPTRRRALWGFSADQLDRRVVAFVGGGRAVPLVAQTGRRFGGRIEERRPARRWCPVESNAPSTMERCRAKA